MDNVEFSGFIISSVILATLGILLQSALGFGFDIRVWLLDLYWLVFGIFQISFWLPRLSR